MVLDPQARNEEQYVPLHRRNRRQAQRIGRRSTDGEEGSYKAENAAKNKKKSGSDAERQKEIHWCPGH